MNIKNTIVAIALSILICIGIMAQNFSTSNYITTEAFNPMTYSNWVNPSGHNNSTTLELKNGNLYVTHRTHEACFAATIPGCSGHGKTWRDIYSASNGVVILKLTINQVLVTRTNVTTTQTYEWPE